MSQTKRRAYTGSKRFDPACRGRGRCPACVSNRTRSTRRAVEAAEDRVREWAEKGAR